MSQDLVDIWNCPGFTDMFRLRAGVAFCRLGL